VIAAMEWAALERDADVVNLSLGSVPTDGTDPASQAIDSLTEASGALFVVASGNSGTGAVSLKARAWDGDGNRTEQTLMRAYGLREAAEDDDDSD
jgi:subtilisin family serine protease